jgi:phosphatidylinositol dimannoside acyltransferase
MRFAPHLSSLEASIAPRVLRIARQYRHTENKKPLMRHIADNLEDLFALFLIPALIALLPWSIGFRVVKILASTDWLMRRESASAAYASCIRWLPDNDAGAWQLAWRIQRWVDRVDIFLFLLRRDSFLRRHVQMNNAWPAAKGAIGRLFVTFHWGTGVWALRSACVSGHPNAFLSIAFDEVTDKRYPVASLYSRLRMYLTAKAGGQPVIYTGGSVSRIMQTLRESNNVVALVDLVAGEGKASIPINLFGRPAALPRGVIRLAVEHQIPSMVFLCYTDPKTGKRNLSLTPSSIFSSESAMANFLASELEGALRMCPWAWSFWVGVDGLMRDPR